MPFLLKVNQILPDAVVQSFLIRVVQLLLEDHLLNFYMISLDTKKATNMINYAGIIKIDNKNLTLTSYIVGKYNFNKSKNSVSSCGRLLSVNSFIRYPKS